ncbi:FK506 BINDING PROTEIN 53 [Wolffia australiana]
MAFWGVEVKPGKSFTLTHDSSRGALRITQATLGNGTASKRTVVQCSVANEQPVLLCSLLPDKSESCSLDLEFEEEDEVVFSVVGPRSVHLTGYFVNESRHNVEDSEDSDSYGGDVWEIGSDASGSGDDEDFMNRSDDDDDDDDDDVDMSPTNRPNSGVVIEEISEDERQGHEGNAVPQGQIVKYNKSAEVESEDEDGFPVSPTNKAQKNKSAKNKKVDSKSLNTNQSKEAEVDLKESFEVTGKKKKKKEKTKATNSLDANVDRISRNKTNGEHPESLKSGDNKARQGDLKQGQEKPQNEGTTTETDEKNTDVISKQKKKKNKKKKAKDISAGESGPDNSNVAEPEKIGVKRAASDALGAPTEGDNKQQKDKKMRETKTASSESKEKAEAARKPRTFPNGLVIEEVAMGQPDGKRASPGKTVFVHYIGKLQNGKIFDSNIGQRPFKFRLGVGQVIKGWDVGVDGMRVGDKRRLTIPPSMGYGQKGAGGAIPGNSWLLFDVELVNVK